MKPCSKNRKLIAWLALDALDAPEAAALREHLAQCEGCRRYWEEMSKLTEVLVSSQTEPHVEASASFHRRLTEKLQAVESSPIPASLAGWLRNPILNWRIALPALVALVIAVYAMVTLRHDSGPSSPPSPTIQAVSPSSPGNDFAPTIANYQMIANESLEKFDEVLTRQANKGLPRAPVYTLLSPELANSAF